MYEMLRPAQGIPIHWGTFRLSTEGYDTPPRMLDIFMRCRTVDPQGFRALRIGQTITPAFRPGPPRQPEARDIADCQPGSAALDALK